MDGYRWYGRLLLLGLWALANGETSSGTRPLIPLAPLATEAPWPTVGRNASSPPHSVRESGNPVTQSPRDVSESSNPGTESSNPGTESSNPGTESLEPTSGISAAAVEDGLTGRRLEDLVNVTDRPNSTDRLKSTDHLNNNSTSPSEPWSSREEGEESSDPPSYPETYVAMLFERYGGGFLLVLGTLGNVMALVVLTSRRLRALPSSLFLSVLAAVDLAFLLLGQGGRHAVRAVWGVDLPALSATYCKVWYFLVPALSMYSDWVLAGVSVERCIAVSLPLYSKTLLTPARSRLYLLLALLVCAGYYSYVFVYYDVLPTPAPGNTTSTICTLRPVDLLFTIEVRPWLEFVLNSILPATIIILSNGITTCNLVAARRRRRRMTFSEKYLGTGSGIGAKTGSGIGTGTGNGIGTGNGTGSGNGNRSGNGTGNGTGSISGTGSVTGKGPGADTNAVVGMLLSISVAFVVLTTPVRVGFVLDKVFPAEYWASDRRRAVSRLFWAVGVFCLYLSHAANFPLYMLTGGEFRRGLRDVCCRRGKEKGRRGLGVSGSLGAGSVDRLDKESQSQAETSSQGTQLSQLDLATLAL